MGRVTVPEKAKLFAGILCADEALAAEAEGALSAEFGSIDCRSAAVPFDFTNYYEKEMGKGLIRWWVGFERLAPPDGLAVVKQKTNKIESKFAKGPHRRVNIDPGYLNESKLVLASTKDFSHRIYLAGGIYAEITLVYKAGSYRGLEWTYPDYLSKTAGDFFGELREVYRKQLGRNP
ncbi:MAG: DUF4416 family protein [Endomicrobiales bacterium]|nr:DUF4416 family protein [Endomicrobiales bacterium]